MGKQSKRGYVLEDEAVALAAYMLTTMGPEQLDAMLIREGYLIETPCRKCGRATLWAPGQEDLCVCNECAG